MADSKSLCPLNGLTMKCNKECAWWNPDTSKCVVFQITIALETTATKTGVVKP